MSKGKCSQVDGDKRSAGNTSDGGDGLPLLNERAAFEECSTGRPESSTEFPCGKWLSFRRVHTNQSTILKSVVKILHIYQGIPEVGGVGLREKIIVSNPPLLGVEKVEHAPKNEPVVPLEQGCLASHVHVWLARLAPPIKVSLVRNYSSQLCPATL